VLTFMGNVDTYLFFFGAFQGSVGTVSLIFLGGALFSLLVALFSPSVVLFSPFFPLNFFLLTVSRLPFSFSLI